MLKEKNRFLVVENKKDSLGCLMLTDQAGVSADW